MTYQAHGNRFERTETRTVVATSAGRAADKVHKAVKSTHINGNASRKVKETFGGTFHYVITVGKRVETDRDDEDESCNCPRGCSSCEECMRLGDEEYHRQIDDMVAREG
jgi:hypothetical protein